MTVEKRRRRRHTDTRLQEWTTWAVRAALIGICTWMASELRTLDQISQDVAVTKTVVQSHDGQLKAIWQRIK